MPFGPTEAGMQRDEWPQDASSRPCPAKERLQPVPVRKRKSALERIADRHALECGEQNILCRARVGLSQPSVAGQRGLLAGEASLVDCENDGWAP